MTKVVNKPKETNMINLQISKNIAKSLLDEVRSSLENMNFEESDFEETYELYKILKNKLK